MSELRPQREFGSMLDWPPIQSANHSERGVMGADASACLGDGLPDAGRVCGIPGRGMEAGSPVTFPSVGEFLTPVTRSVSPLGRSHNFAERHFPTIRPVTESVLWGTDAPEPFDGSPVREVIGSAMSPS